MHCSGHCFSTTVYLHFKVACGLEVPLDLIIKTRQSTHVQWRLLATGLISRPSGSYFVFTDWNSVRDVPLINGFFSEIWVDSRLGYRVRDLSHAVGGFGSSLLRQVRETRRTRVHTAHVQTPLQLKAAQHGSHPDKIAVRKKTTHTPHNGIVTGATELVHRCEILPGERRLQCTFLPQGRSFERLWCKHGAT